MRAVDEAPYLQQVCRIVVEGCGHTMVWVGFAEDDEGKSVRHAAHSGFDQGYLDTLHVTWADTERGRGPTGTAIRTGRPVVCRNMLTDPDFAPWREQALARGYASSIALPLMTGGKAFGALMIYSRVPDPFSEDEVALLTELADDLSFGISAIRFRAAHARAEEALRHSEERYRILVELSPDAVFVHRDGRIVFVNPAAIALFGATDPQQIIGRSPFDFFDPEFHPAMRARIQSLLRGDTVPLLEEKLMRLDGAVREVEIVSTAFEDHEGRAIQVIPPAGTSPTVSGPRSSYARRAISWRSSSQTRTLRSLCGTRI